jgi:hypothetical protein
VKSKRIIGIIFIVGMVILSLAVSPQAVVNALGDELDFPNAGVPGDVLLNLPPQSWHEIPNTPMREICPPNYFGGKDYEFHYFCSGVISAWGGGTLDTLRNRMVLWGGGHNDYYGNELYVFDIDRLAWERLTDPDLDFEYAQVSQEKHASGNPTARHTYGGLAYIAHADRFFSHGGAVTGSTPSGGDRVWTFDFENLEWEEHNLDNMDTVSRENEHSIYDPISHNIYLFNLTELYQYNYDLDQWTQLDNDQISWRALGVAIDTKRNLLVSVGEGYVSVYDLNSQTYQRQLWDTTGGNEIVSAYAPGLEYDPVRDRVVGWAGGDIYSLDLETRQWTRIAAPGGPKRDTNGTFGRFRYIPKYDVFFAVTDVDDNVFFYKPAAAGSEPILGDLNLDRVVDRVDVNLAARVILGLELDSDVVSRMDVNLDGKRDVLDLQAIINLVKGT